MPKVFSGRASLLQSPPLVVSTNALLQLLPSALLYKRLADTERYKHLRARRLAAYKTHAEVQDFDR